MKKAQKNAPKAFEEAIKYTEEFLQKELSILKDPELIQEFTTIIQESLAYTRTFALGTNSSGFSYFTLTNLNP